MDKKNFRCPKTGKEFMIAEYSISNREEGTFYKDKHGRQLVNPDNNEPLEAIEMDRGFCTTFGKIASMSPAEKKKVMKKRSRDHNNATTQRDEFHHKNITGTQKAKGIG